MSSSPAVNQSVSIGFPVFSLLTIILVIAKLTGHFAYSWWIVFLPLIASTGIFFAILLIVLIVVAIVAFIALFKK
jgi:hypothetical protein